MSKLVLCIVLCFLLPLILLCIYIKNRAKRIMIMFCAGAVVCLIACYINNIILGASGIHASIFTVLISPPVEEVLKFVPIFLYTIFVNKGKNDSITSAYSVGIGFCLVENTYYLISEISTANIFWMIFRSIGTGLMHGMSATIIGLGLLQAKERKTHHAIIILGTICAAIIYHGLFNFLIQQGTLLRIIGVQLPILTYIGIFAFTKKDKIKEFFSETEQ